MTGLPGGAFFVGVRLGGAWRVLGGFLTGANMRPKMAFAGWEGLAFAGWEGFGFRGVGGFGFRKGWEGFGFRGVEGLDFERGGGGWMLGHGWGSGMLGAGCLGVACYLSFCRLVLFAKPTTFAIVKTKATPPRGACYGINTNTHNHY